MTGSRVLFVISLIPLTGCAASVMTDESWEARIVQQKTGIPHTPDCCIELSEINFESLPNNEKKHHFSSSNLMIQIDGNPRPVIGLEIPDNANFLQFLSYSDKDGGLVNFSNRMFIRPSVIFFDLHANVLSVRKDLPLCFGEKAWKPVAWVNLRIPEHARQIAIYPSIDKPVQQIDFARRGFSGGVVAEAISKANNLSYAELRVGLVGPVGIEFFDEPPRILGTCRSDLPIEDSLTPGGGFPSVD